MDFAIAMLIAGIGAGCALHELIIAHAIQRMPHSLCDYCEWWQMRKKPFQKK